MPPLALLGVALPLRLSKAARTAFRSTELILALSGVLLLDGHASAQQVTAGTNVNMVGGPASISPGPPPTIIGDPFLQRQNEPSMACSSRNPLNCIASANDYRLVNVPGLPDGKVTGDAWLGVFWTHDGGMSWRSTVLPGFPQDSTPDGLGFPLHGRDAAADPVVRAGTNGLLYLSGIAFNRATVVDDDRRDGDEGVTGGVFVSLFIDDNNAQTIDTPIRYVKSVLVEDSGEGIFLDKPWIAVDIPRAHGGTCTIPGSGGAPTQTVPAGNVYIVYARFHGTGTNATSDLLFRRSTTCGQTWSPAIALYSSTTTIGQGATLSVNPLTGEVLVAWREFGTATPAQHGRIMTAKSSDGGAHFSAGTPVVDLGAPDSTSTAFDQGTLPTALLPNYRMFRTNGYPTTCIDTAGLYRLVWSQRGVGTLTGDARIMVSTSVDGLTWTPGTAIDNYLGAGNQLMPAITCHAEGATVVWYDQRFDAAGFGPQIFDVIDPLSAPHTLDVRAAQTNGVGGFAASTSIGVSRYQYAYDTSTTSFVQLEFNPVNWPLFAGGTVPFLGDYLDITPARQFVPTSGGSGWGFVSDTTETPVLHAAWTDNRDISKALLDNWVNWAPPGTSACTATTQTSTRNQNVYTSRLSQGLVVGIEGNSRPVGLVQRAFAAFVQNTDSVLKHVRLTTGQAPWGAASFGSTGPPQAQLDADLPPFGTIARTVFVDVTGPTTPVLLQVVEMDTGTGLPKVGGGTGTAFINADPTAPPPADGSVVAGEVHTPTISDAIVNTYPNPTFINPTFINPTFINPTFINPTFINPTFINPTFINPTFINPTFINPTFINQTYANPTFINQPLTTDVSWQVTNAGTVPTAYNFSALLAQVPAGSAYQLIINRIYSTPGANGCTLGEQLNADIQTVINTPPVSAAATGGNPVSPDVGNATFALAASEMAVVTLRIQHDASSVVTGQSASAVVASQPSNSDGTSAVAVFDTTPPAITVTGGTTVEATGPAGAVASYTVSASDLVDGPLAPTCTPASGTVFAVGSTPVTCTATDAHGNTGTFSFSVTVADTTPPALTVPAAITAEATGPAGAVVSYATSASDAVDGPIVPVCTPASGTTFGVGTVSATCTATDAHGNTATRSFDVTVADTTPPVVTVPAAIAAEATGPAGAVVTFSASATDLVDGVRPTACAPASGTTFAIGSTTVACTATDAHGNAASRSFGVTVADTRPPSLTLPGPITAEATGPAGAVVTFSASAADLVDGVRPVVCAPASGSVFHLGSTLVSCAASDTRGHTTAGTFSVTVRDTTPPVIAAHADLTVSATSSAGAAVAYVPPAAGDAVSGTFAATCVPASGSTFAVGTTPVVCSAKDAAGNAAVPTSFNVTVTNLGPTIVSIFATPCVLWVEDGRVVPVVVAGRITSPTGIASASYTVRDDYGQIKTSGPITLWPGGIYIFTVNVVASRLSTDLVGRHYTITVTGKSTTGVVGSASAVVVVPRDHR